MSTITSSRELDLTVAPQISPRNPVIIRLISLGSATLIAGLVTAFAIFNELTGVVRGLPSPLGLGLIGFAALLTGLSIWMFFGMGPGANRCLWEPGGFILRYRNGRSRSFRWDDPRLHFEISEITHEGRVEYDLTTRMPWHNDVTPELYAAILTEARQRGLDVRTKVSGVPAQSVITNRIRSRAKGRV